MCLHGLVGSGVQNRPTGRDPQGLLGCMQVVWANFLQCLAQEAALLDDPYLKKPSMVEGRGVWWGAKVKSPTGVK